MFPSDLISPRQVFEPNVKADVNVHLYRHFQNMNVVTHREWKHKGPDAALIDFAIWESLQGTLRSERNLHFSKS